MMTQCPKCGSMEVIPDLVLKTGIGGTSGSVGIVLVDPSGKGDPVGAGFRADLCGSCGYTEFYTNKANSLLEAHRKGYVSSKPK